MTLRARITAPPAVLAVTVAELKSQTRINWDEEDGYLETLLKAAITHLEQISGRAFVSQTWVQSFDEFCGVLQLERGDLISIDSVTYYDADGATQTADDGIYDGYTDYAGPFVSLKAGESWPATATRPDAVTVTWKAGFGADATTVPDDIKHAIKLLAAHWFRNREAVGEGRFEELPLNVKALISSYRIMFV